MSIVLMGVRARCGERRGPSREGKRCEKEHTPACPTRVETILYSVHDLLISCRPAVHRSNSESRSAFAGYGAGHQVGLNVALKQSEYF